MHMLLSRSLGVQCGHSASVQCEGCYSIWGQVDSLFVWHHSCRHPRQNRQYHCLFFLLEIFFILQNLAQKCPIFLSGFLYAVISGGSKDRKLLISQMKSSRSYLPSVCCVVFCFRLGLTVLPRLDLNSW